MESKRLLHQLEMDGTNSSMLAQFWQSFSAFLILVLLCILLRAPNLLHMRDNTTTTLTGCSCVWNICGILLLLSQHTLVHYHQLLWLAQNKLQRQESKKCEWESWRFYDATKKKTKTCCVVWDSNPRGHEPADLKSAALTSSANHASMYFSFPGKRMAVR